jgi:hypothetical protein
MKKEPRISLGLLPLARRDIERLRQILGLQRRLLDAKMAPRARRALTHKGTFREALTVARGPRPGARGCLRMAGIRQHEHGRSGRR